MFKLVFEVEMSLKAALKAGLGATNSQSSDDNNNYNKVTKPREFTGKLGALNSKVMCVSYPFQKQKYLQSYRTLYQSQS